MNAMALVMINAPGATDPGMKTAYHVVGEDMKNVLVATGLEPKDVIHVLGMDMISMEINVPGAGDVGIKNAFHAMATEEKNVSRVEAEVIKIVLGAGDVGMMIVTIAVATVSLLVSDAMVMVS